MTPRASCDSATRRRVAFYPSIPSGTSAPNRDCVSTRPPDVPRAAGGAEASPRRWYLTVPRGEGEEPGDPHYFQVTLVPIVDRGGHCRGVLEFRRDERMTLALERYLIDEAERKEGEARERSEERDRSDEAAGALREALASLRESQTELLYRDRLLGLGRLVAGVAHEMHTPLGAVLSSVDLIAAPRLACGARRNPAGRSSFGASMPCSMGLTMRPG